MDWSTQIKVVNKKCFSAIASMYPYKNILSVDSRIKLVNAYVFSRLNYASIVWLNKPTSFVKNKVNKIVRSAARFVLDKKKFDHVTDDINLVLEWLNCKYRFQYEILVFCLKINRELCPNYFVNYIHLDNITSKSTRNNYYFRPTIQFNTHWGERSIRYIGPLLWLNLPDDLKDLSL